MEYVPEFQIKIYFLNLSIITNLVNVLLCFVTPPTISSSAHCINSVAKPLQPPFSSDFTSGAYKNNYKRQNEFLTSQKCLSRENESDPRSNEHYLSSSENKAWKKFRPERDLNPWPLRYQCSALPAELTSQLGAGHYVGSK